MNERHRHRASHTTHVECNAQRHSQALQVAANDEIPALMLNSQIYRQLSTRLTVVTSDSQATAAHARCLTLVPK